MIDRLPCLQHVRLGHSKGVERYIRRSLFPKQPISCEERLSCALVEWPLSAQAIDELAFVDCDCHNQPQITGRDGDILTTVVSCGRQDAFCRDIIAEAAVSAGVV